MSRKVCQLRYFGDNNRIYNQPNLDLHENEINYPETLTKTRLQSGTAFIEYTPIIQLGVQSLPGTQFRLNANLDPIVVGTTGIYELDLADSSSVITSIQFEKKSLELIEANDNAYLIIDIVYEEE